LRLILTVYDTRLTQHGRENESTTATATTESENPIRNNGNGDYQTSVKPSDVRATLSFVVPVVGFMSCVPTGFACYYSAPEKGTIIDSDFYEMIAASIMLLLSLGTMIWPTCINGRLPGLAGLWTWVLVAVSFLCACLAPGLYLAVPTMWSIMIAFAGGVAQVLVLLQLVNSL